MKLPTFLKKRKSDIDDDELSYDYHELLHEIGSRGKYQFRMVFLLWLATSAAGIAVVVFAFTAFTPKYRCAVKPCEDPTTATFYENAENQTFPEYVYRAYGVDFNESSTIFSMGESCQTPEFEVESRPSIASSSGETCDSFLQRITSNGSDASLMTCSHSDLIYDTSIVHTSLITVFGFTCTNTYLYNIFNAFYMSGMLVGSFILGVMSDKYGRMSVLMVSVIMVSVPSTMSAFLTTHWIYGILRFLTGVGGMGCFMIPYIYVLENTSHKYVVGLTCLVGIGFPLGELIFSAFAYFIRDWFTLHLVAYVPLISGLVIMFLLPESTRWLINKGRMAEAKDAIQDMAEMNLGHRLDENRFKDHSGVDKRCELDEETHLPVPKPGFVDLFRPRIIGFRSLNMFFQWYSVTMAYYGITFALTTLSGDPYTNFSLGVMTEIPGIIFAYFATDIVGRRFILSFLQTLSGISCILAGLLINSPSLSLLQTSLALIGKFGATCAFSTVYLYTSELFPTNIRGTAVGICSTIARVGGICSLLLGTLSKIWKPFPMVIMGSVATLAGFLALFFPETTGVGLPETMEDALTIHEKCEHKMCKRRKD